MPAKEADKIPVLWCRPAGHQHLLLSYSPTVLQKSDTVMHKHVWNDLAKNMDNTVALMPAPSRTTKGQEGSGGLRQQQQMQGGGLRPKGV
eukprot:6214398-Pleurochrysis_carterae.AAC.4